MNYEVTLSRLLVERRTQLATVDIEAATAEEAFAKAEALLSEDTDQESDLDWWDFDCESEVESNDVVETTPIPDAPCR